ncbi:MAG: 6-carboxytetrahydropterin synthase [Pseudonocardiales bacterium]|nr:6-carboxytetrahydropterin synthase [Pseudonocardiales bacterium]
MFSTVEVGRGEFSFSAAHAGLHDGEFESLHGHTFQLTLRLSGIPADDGMLIEFGKVKAALREAIDPLRRRTMMPGRSEEVLITSENDTLSIVAGRKRYVLPAEDVVVLPLANTTTEAIAGYLLERALPYLPGYGLTTVELEVSEAPDTSASARFDFT